MSTTERIVFSIYFFLVALVCYTVFIVWPDPVTIGYSLIAALYIFPIIMILIGVQQRFTPLLVAISTGITMLIIIDPIRPGLYGYDAYATLQNANQFSQFESLTQFVEQQDRPLLYMLIWPLKRLTHIDLETIGKYLPLIGVSTPIIFYCIFRFYLPQDISATLSLGVGSLRNLILFRTRLMPEILGGILFAFGMYLFLRRDLLQKKIFLLSGIGVAVTFTHHLSGGMFVLFCLMWLIGIYISEGIHRIFSLRRLHTYTSIPLRNVATVLFISTISFIATFLYWSPGSMKALGQEAILTVSGRSRSLPEGTIGGSNGEKEILSLLSGPGTLTLLVLLALLAIYGYFHKDRQPDWIIASSYFSGIAAVFYIVFLSIGQVVWLAPTRFLGFFAPMLVAVSGYVIIFQVKFTEKKRRYIISLFIILFIITQVTAAPSHVIYSDRSVERIGDGHYADHTFAMGEWASTYGVERAATWELGLHQFYYGISVTDVPSKDCTSSTILWRSEAEELVSENALHTSARVRSYDSGNGVVFNC